MIYLTRLRCRWPSLQPIPHEWKKNGWWSDWRVCSEKDYNNRETISNTMKQYIYEWKAVSD